MIILILARGCWAPQPEYCVHWPVTSFQNFKQFIIPTLASDYDIAAWWWAPWNYLSSLVQVRVHFSIQQIPHRPPPTKLLRMDGPIAAERHNEQTPLLHSYRRSTPLPKLQIGILLFLQISEPLCSMSIYPYINEVRFGLYSTLVFQSKMSSAR